MTVPNAPSIDSRQPLRFSSADFSSRQQAFERLCEATADICDVTMLGAVEDFHVATSTLHLGAAVLLEARSSAQRYDRTPRHVARGIDHFHVSMYLAGGAEFVARERTFLQRSGDVCLIDMAQPSQTREIPSEEGVVHVMTFLLPRTLLAPLLPAELPATAIRVLAYETAYGDMLGEYMLSLRRQVRRLANDECQAAVQSLAQLVACGVSRHAAADVDEPPSHPSQAALRVRIKRHIEDNLGAASLGVQSLCRRFAVSRASLYRLFAPQSPATYIQQRRLQRAFAMLISPAFRPWRIIDIAMECHFSSDATFIRAFRRQFGLTPGEARELAGRRSPAAPAAHGAALPQPDAETVRWLTQLTGAMAPSAAGGSRSI